MMMRKALCFWLVWLCAAVPAGRASSVQIDGREFAARYEQDGVEMVLQGVGRKNFLFLEVFVAGFYAGPGWDRAQPLADGAKRLEVSYFRDIPARKLAEETRRRIKMNTSAAEYAQIDARVAVMDRYFVAIHPDDRFVLTYVPGQGTRFEYNGEVLGMIEGADFARALFAVWVGDRPIDPVLKAHLLGDEDDALPQDPAQSLAW